MSFLSLARHALGAVMALAGGRAVCVRLAIVGIAAVAAIAASALTGVVGQAHAREFVVSRDATTGLPEVGVDALPIQVRQTLALIRAGGPFPYRKDGVTFNNRERLLPRRPRGHYTEYTVPTPRARDRGGRRIVAAGEPTRSSEFYYTDDHYQSFRRIREPG